MSRLCFSHVYRLFTVHFLRCCETLVYGAKYVGNPNRSGCMTRMRGLFILLCRFLLFRYRMMLLLAPCSSSTTTLISVRSTMIRFSRRQNSPYITCAAAGLKGFGGLLTVLASRKRSIYRYRKMHRSNHHPCVHFVEPTVHRCSEYTRHSEYSEYRTIFVPRVLRVLEYWWPKYSEYLEYEQY